MNQSKIQKKFDRSACFCRHTGARLLCIILIFSFAFLCSSCRANPTDSFDSSSSFYESPSFLSSAENIEPIEPKEILLTTDQLELSPGETFLLSYSLLPSEASPLDAFYTSSDSEVATVSDDGTVTALSAGTASIIVTLENNLSATLFLTVLSPSSSGPTIDMGDFTAWNQICDWYMIVINKDNAIPEDYNPQITTYQSIQIDQRVLPHLQEMMDAASADGAGLWLASGYRDIALQTKLYNRKVNYFLGQGYSEESALAKAATIVAKPGTSEHNTGLSVDFNNVEEDFRTTKGYRWLTEHAAEYGFIERYPTDKQDITNIIYEPRHFRYVGVENAKAIQESGMCLEEYVSSLS